MTKLFNYNDDKKLAIIGLKVKASARNNKIEGFLSTDGKFSPNFGAVPNENGTDWIAKSNLLDVLPRAREGFLLKKSILKNRTHF
jgi:hypothetical protein